VRKPEKSPVENYILDKDFAGGGNYGSTGRRFLLLLYAINAIALIALIGLLYFDRNAADRTSPLLSKLRWWAQPWGEYVPLVVSKADSSASEAAAMLGYLSASLSLLLAGAALYYGRGRERLVLPLCGVLLAIVWTQTGTSWDLIRLRGQSTMVVAYAESVSEFAQQLENSWPDQGGDIKDFGSFLAYPYGAPRTLLMLGDTRIPNTSLRVAAVERTPGEAIRFQLTGDAPDVWLEWRTSETEPTQFQGGLQQIHTPTASLKIAANTFVVRYSMTGPQHNNQHITSAE